MTIWDGGGSDAYDFSSYTTNLTVDLNPGGWSTASTTQLASLGSGHYAAGNIANALLYRGNVASLIENAVGGSGSDTLLGNAANNKLTGGGDSDILDGGAGADTAAYSGLLADYSWLPNANGSWTVADLRGGSPDGTDTLWNLELLQFADTIITIGSYTPPPVVVNAAPTITSAPTSVSLTEWADNSADEVANTLHTSSGYMTFSDADAGDTHAASFMAQGTGYVGTFALAGVDQAGDSFGWSFAVADSALDYLKAGQTLTQKYDVTVDDGHGGTAMQSVTITLIGTDDLTTAKKTPWAVARARAAATTPAPTRRRTC
jgi:VCBS repeat-containing protein